MNAQAELFQEQKKQINLRDYQRHAADAIVESFKDNDSALVVMPTGCGKTVLFSEIINRFQPNKAMVIAHREELIFQAKEKIERCTGLKSNIEMGQFRADTNWGLFGMSQVVISTVQTQNSGDRLLNFKPEDFGLLVIDEAHHCTSPTYRKIIDYYRQNPRLKVLGVTATPDRADEEALGQIFETVAFDYEILDAIKDGWLVPVEQQMVEVDGLDFSSVRTTAGDLNGADLAEIMEFEKNLHGIADPTIKIVGDRRTLVFTASVAQAERLCEIFNRHRAGCSAFVCGKTQKDDRRRIISDFDHGKIQFMVNCGVFTEGWDDKAIDEMGVQVIAIARPTKSRALYAQMCGRGLRPLPGVVDGHELDTPDNRLLSISSSNKSSCLIIDYVGNSGRHKLMSTADILGGNVSDEVIELAKKKARENGRAMRMDEALQESQEEIEKEKERKRLAEEARRAKLLAKAKYTSKNVDPFDVFQLTPQQDRGWHKGKVLSDKQKDMLMKQGINPEGMNYASAKQMLLEIFRRFDNGLCSFKQAKLLKRYGYDGNQTREEASKIIDAIAKNGWRKINA